MGIGKSLTNDLERAVKFYRVPVLSALGLSLRTAPEDRFLVTDPRTEDVRRNLVKLSRIVRIERQMTKLDVGVDSRQFVDMGGLLLFDGMTGPGGRIVPVPNVSLSGGRSDAENVTFTATGTADDKQAKVKRYVLRRPEQVTWRIRTPVMMAGETTVIDYLAFRVTQLQYLQSIAIKWSDRRWDARSVPLTADMYRPEGERTQQIVLAPVWMDDSMSILDPNVWGAYESLIRANYEEYLGRHVTEYEQDLEAFLTRYQDYLITLKPGQICANQAEENRILAGRLERRLTTAHNRTLTISFNRNLDTRTDSYHPGVSDPTTATDVTADLFNQLDADNIWRMTSSFEAPTLAEDGWYGVAGHLETTSSIPPGLPPFTTDRAGTGIVGTKAAHLADGFMTRRMILPDGRFILKFWVRNLTGTARIDLVRNTRLRPKQITRSLPTSRITSITHFKDSYETVAAAVLRGPNEWREVFVSFTLKDHFFVASEGYPAHEVFIVLSVDDASAANFDHLTLLKDTADHDIQVINTITHAPFPDLFLDHEKVVDLEAAFAPDSEYLGRERAGSFFRFDGANICCVAKHRNGYNLHPTGTNINAWWKANSADESANKVLERRGSFNLFQKGTSYLPSYQASINGRSELTVGWGGTSGASSASFYNYLIHPSVADGTTPAHTAWGDSTILTRYLTCLTQGGKQPREWTSAGDTIVVTPAANIPIGNGKLLTITNDDPYLTTGRTEMADPAPSLHVTVWRYFEWHARNAYRQLLPEEQILKNEVFTDFAKYTQTGNVFMAIPLSAELMDVPPQTGTYSPSPLAWGAHLGLSGTPLTYPISPCDWGQSPAAVWPTTSLHPSPYGSPPVFIPALLSTVLDVDSLLAVTPMFIDGKVTFDRWWNLDVNADQSTVEIRINAILMAVAGGGTFNVQAGKENSEDLWIATANPDDTNTCSPVSCWSFKITQAKLTPDDIASLVHAESVNLNELQYNVWGQYLDFDADKQFEWYQDDVTDYGLHMVWVDQPPSPLALDRAWPGDISKVYGKVTTSVADRIQIDPLLDRNYDVLDDHFDERYLQELIDVQVLGFSDGLIFWDFLTDRNDAYHSFTHRVYNPACKAYQNVTLDYRTWVHGLVANEFNSITAITDPVPTLDSLNHSPSPALPTTLSSSPPATYGDDTNELVMSGVKGWFGFNDLLGYRDSLEQLDNEGLIFNFLQIELRFRADRSVLERHLKDFADSYATIFADDYPGHRMAR